MPWYTFIRGSDRSTICVFLIQGYFLLYMTSCYTLIGRQEQKHNHKRYTTMLAEELGLGFPEQEREELHLPGTIKDRGLDVISRVLLVGTGALLRSAFNARNGGV